MSSKPQANRTSSKKTTMLVELITPEFKNHTLSVYAMGTVIAAQEVNLTSRISGMVLKTNPNFVEGGILKKGEQIVSLDPTDYKLVIAQRKSDLEKARFNLKLEQGQQAIALREFQLLGSKLAPQEKELVLRKPHLQAAKAALNAAEASLKQAQLDLERTRPYSPFDAIVISRNANVGSWISTFSTGTPLAKLVGIKNFWIDVSLPVDKLRWINVPGINSKKGASVRIAYETGWGKGIYRQGEITRLKASVEKEGRMAKLVVEVNDPLSQKPNNKNSPPLMLGTFVRLKIQGHTLNNVAALPESLLHEGNKLWLMTPDNKLAIHPVTPIWREQGLVYFSIDALPQNTQIIKSNLSTPVQGMDLREATPVTKDNT
ncbi:MAG: efflux RND transporter periplasmic adaptor subunit [Methylococcales bacterium]|nr:efflux RND transporter periplasmic adaptor subunit [Methylococcales bacterium]